VRPSLRTRLRWRLDELRHVDDAKLIGGLLLTVALVFGGFLAARAVSRGSAGSQSATRMITVRQKLRVREHGHVVTHWRVRRLFAQPQTVMRTEMITTPNGVRLVRRPVSRVVYRNRVVSGPARTVTNQVTDSRVVTVTRQVTVVDTTTVVSTQTVTLPITITVTVP
jgi:hypothetical protein